MHSELQSLPMALHQRAQWLRLSPLVKLCRRRPCLRTSSISAELYATLLTLHKLSDHDKDKWAAYTSSSLSTALYWERRNSLVPAEVDIVHSIHCHRVCPQRILDTAAWLGNVKADNVAAGVHLAHAVVPNLFCPFVKPSV